MFPFFTEMSLKRMTPTVIAHERVSGVLAEV
jgi:hypothetical protein